jgi:hypothetical protein
MNRYQQLQINHKQQKRNRKKFHEKNDSGLKKRKIENPNKNHGNPNN